MFEPTGVRRRTVLAGCGGLCAAALGGCAAYGPAGPVTEPVPPAVPAGEVSVLAAVADVPVGGGVVLVDRDVVVTQPVPGTFKAFSATCTSHQGCTVSEVANGTINCPCHGSSFAVADGSVTAGPATTPLPEKAVAVRDSAVVLT
jgi:Rieske Fe-S protein